MNVFVYFVNVKCKYFSIGPDRSKWIYPSIPTVKYEKRIFFPSQWFDRDFVHSSLGFFDAKRIGGDVNLTGYIVFVEIYVNSFFEYFWKKEELENLCLLVAFQLFLNFARTSRKPMISTVVKWEPLFIVLGGVCCLFFNKLKVYPCSDGSSG